MITKFKLLVFFLPLFIFTFYSIPMVQAGEKKLTLQQKGKNYKPQKLPVNSQLTQHKFKRQLLNFFIKKMQLNSINKVEKNFCLKLIEILLLDKNFQIQQNLLEKGLAYLQKVKTPSSQFYALMAFLAYKTNHLENSLKLATQGKKRANSKNNFTNFFLNTIISANDPQNELLKLTCADNFKNIVINSDCAKTKNNRIILLLAEHAPLPALNKWFLYELALDNIKNCLWLKEMILGKKNLYYAVLTKNGVKIGKNKKENSEAFYLTNAGNHFKKAYIIDPKSPESASFMIQICTSGSYSHRHNPRFWFDKAVMAQFDYQPAYEYMFRAILQSNDTTNILLFALECFETKRFDTIVPLYLPAGLAFTSSYIPNYNWKLPFSLKQVKKALNELSFKLKNEAIYKTRKNELKTLQLLIAYWTGETKKAYMLLLHNQNIPNYDLVPFIKYKKFYCLDRKKFQTILQLYNSNIEKELKKIDNLILNNKNHKAIKLLKKIIVKTKNLQARQWLIEQLIYLKLNYSVHTLSANKINLLFTAINNKLLFASEELIKTGYGKKYKSALIPAIEANQPEIFKMLLKYYNPTETKGFPERALYYAIKYDNSAIIEILLNDQRVNINKKFSNSFTPTAYALLNNKNKAFLKLVNAKANLNLKSGPNNETVLHIAARKNLYSKVAFLINKGADTTIKNRFGKTAAEVTNNQGIINFLNTQSGLSK